MKALKIIEAGIAAGMFLGICGMDPDMAGMVSSLAAGLAYLVSEL